MVTTPAGSGVVMTGAIFLPFYGPYGTRVRIRADVAGTTDSVELWAGSLPEVDAAAPDARPIDARPPDAMPADAAPDT
jgi:hypothetical protein